MHDPRTVGDGQCLGDLREDLGGVGRRQTLVLLGEGGEIAALDVLHHQPLIVALGDEVEDSHDVWMVELGRQPGLALGASHVG